MDNKNKIEKLKKNLDNPMFPEKLKSKLKEEIAKLETQINLDKSNKIEIIKPSKSTYIKSEKIGPKKITIVYAEGTISEYDQFPKSYNSFEAANKALIPVYKNVYKNGENEDEAGYNKASFLIEFENGEEYQGKLDIGKYDNPTTTKNLIGDHVVDFLKKSLKNPTKYDKIDLNHYKDWLENYRFYGSVVNQKEKPKSKSKKPNNYYLHSDIDTITILRNGKKFIFSGKDVLDGVHKFSEGGKVNDISTYIPIRDIVEVTLKNGKKVKSQNGYRIKNGALPIKEKSDTLSDKWVIVKSNGYYSLNARTGNAVFLPSIAVAYTYTEEVAKKIVKQIQMDHKFEVKAVPYGTKLEDDPYDKYEKGGIIKEDQIDLFENYKLVPENVSDILDEYDFENLSYEECEELNEKLKKIGYEFSYGLDSIPYNLRKIDGEKFDYLLKYDGNKIKQKKDIIDFFTFLNDKSFIFHPDDNFSPEPNLSKKEAYILNKYMDDCWKLCDDDSELDIYEMGMSVINKEHKSVNKVKYKKIVRNPKGNLAFKKAKEIRLPGEKWTDAVKRASKILK